jgi:hypothetical protein
MIACTKQRSKTRSGPGTGEKELGARVLEQWLPPAYEVVTRKYVIPEVGTRSFETDIIVLRPSYPVPLRSREEILAGGVAAAFSVKLTLDAAGIRDGVERAVALRRGLITRHGTLRDEMAPPFPVGLLAHSHIWKAPGSAPADLQAGGCAPSRRTMISAESAASRPSRCAVALRALTRLVTRSGRWSELLLLTFRFAGRGDGIAH